MENPDFCWWRCSTTWKYEKCEPHFEASDQKKSEAQNPANIPPVLVQLKISRGAKKIYPGATGAFALPSWNHRILRIRRDANSHAAIVSETSELQHQAFVGRGPLWRNTSLGAAEPRSTWSKIDEDQWRSMPKSKADEHCDIMWHSGFD